MNLPTGARPVPVPEAEMPRDLPAGPDTRSLVERVAALEARFAPVQVTFTPSPPMTEAQEAGLRESFARALEAGPRQRVMLPEPVLTLAQVRYLLRQCVTVVKPGETLVIRGRDWTLMQVREIQDWVDAMHDDGTIGFKVLAVIGDELGIVQAGPDQP